MAVTCIGYLRGNAEREGESEFVDKMFAKNSTWIAQCLERKTNAGRLSWAGSSCVLYWGLHDANHDEREKRERIPGNSGNIDKKQYLSKDRVSRTPGKISRNVSTVMERMLSCMSHFPYHEMVGSEEVDCMTCGMMVRDIFKFIYPSAMSSVSSSSIWLKVFTKKSFISHQKPETAHPRKNSTLFGVINK